MVWLHQQALLDNFANRNFLLRPDLNDNPEEVDRIEWILTNHDVLVPLELLLKAAMNACELHPCGNGYPRDQIQNIVCRASNPPAEYVELQESQLQLCRKSFKQVRKKIRSQAAELRAQAVVERLSRGERRRMTIDVGSRSLGEDSKMSFESIGSMKPAAQHEFARRSLGTGSGSYVKSNQEGFKVDISDTFKSASCASQHEMARRALGSGSGSCSKTVQESLRSDLTETFKVVQDFGVHFEGSDLAWIDVFCLELLEVWFQQHSVVQAQMAHAFDEFDEVNCKLQH